MIRELAGPVASSVSECACGETAIAAAGEFRPDIVTMDARMPGLSGIEACRIIHQSRPQVQVVVVSAYNVPALRSAALQAGAIAFVAKDNLEELRPIFARYVAGGSRPEPDQPQSASQRTED